MLRVNSSFSFHPLQLALQGRLLLLTFICIGSFALSQGAIGGARAAAAAPEADLGINKSGEESVRRDGTISYNLVVTNGGPDDATNVTISDPLPANTSFVTASASQGEATFANGTLTVSFGTIIPFESASATFVVKVDNDVSRGTTISNTATVTSDTPDPDSSNNSANALTVVTGPFAGDLLISEFRLRGPSGANDEFIEIYNNLGTDQIVEATDDSAGYGIAASDGVLRCTIPNGTRIPNGGHYLCVNSVGYSLASYPAGNGTTATGDATYTTDIPDNAGIALFSTATPSSFTLANRFDAAGSSSEASTLYKEGTGYPTLTPFSIDYAFVRDECGKGGSIATFGPCPTTTPKDTDNNAADFYFVDTNGISAGAGQRLGAPGPQNLSSPVQRNSALTGFLLDTSKSSSNPPNRVRDFTSSPANNSTFGTLDLRRRIVNTTEENVTRLRFRVIDITTFHAPSGVADLRPRTSTAVVVSGIGDAETCSGNATPCTVTVQGTTLEQPPTQPNGGGFNSSLSSDTVTLDVPLAPGASINVRFLLGRQQTGNFKFFVNIEALTAEVIFLDPQSPRKPSKGVRVAKPVKSR
jgi:uncharacterized repeat protein (TIGR01451 family)